MSEKRLFRKVLVANRGEIARRVIRTLKTMGIKSVAIYSDPDRFAPHVREADEAVRVGPAAAAESYLNIPAIMDAIRATGAEAVHPGYGFLSENTGFAEALIAAGIAFIGPTPEHMRAFAMKHTAREIAQRADVPLLPGTGLIGSLEEALQEAARIGYPVMLKSTAGGGGIGLQLCQSAEDLPKLYETVKRLAEANFKDAGLFIEKYVAEARHIEVQIFGDGMGNVIALGERDCSAQRRNQKVIEETPAPNLPPATREALHAAAVRLAHEVGYASAGTVEFIADADTDKFYFLEVNTRLQVEHPVTEMVTGHDLVALMVQQASGTLPPLQTLLKQPSGHSIEVRIYAEDPARNFQPSSGMLTEARFPQDVRVDHWIARGTEVSPFYDPLLAKLIVHGKDRPEAIAKLSAALDASELQGITTNLEYLRKLAVDKSFAAGKIRTRSLNTFVFQPTTIDVLAPGAQSSIQDYPGRMGLWHIGVPPSGPMDSLSFRLANRLLGNADGVPALEMTLSGPTLKFNRDAVVALAGAHMPATVDGEPVEYWRPIAVRRGQTLAIGTVSGPGQRAYLAVRHGFDVPDFLGSGAAFSLGKFGGHGVGVLRTGDTLRLRTAGAIEPEAVVLGENDRPILTNTWEIAVLYGPHGAPDFFLDEDIATLFSTAYEVHYNSARTGVRLIGPKPKWARKDGGEAGLHPSNIHDNAYAVGTIDFTGDMPIILGPDGPSLGGFVCPATLAKAELWKLGQLKAGDKVRFVPIDEDEAARLRDIEERWIKTLRRNTSPPRATDGWNGAIMETIDHCDEKVVYRRAGDDYLLVEYGPLTLDLKLRFRVHALMTAVGNLKLPGLIEMTPGIRSLQFQVDPDKLPLRKLLHILRDLEPHLPAPHSMQVPSRVVHLPLSWDDDQAREAVRKYHTLVRPDAPWCPSNIEFIRRINGLESIEDVKRIVFDADYLVLGLGDVYLGAPVATPLDPRHRLVTTKYNPARTWTPENAVGIGGAYMCVYGMEGPGGYQLVGRTVQMWNPWRPTKSFRDGKPWLLRFFDRIRFFPVSAEELLDMRAAMPHGAYDVKIESGAFALRDYQSFLDRNATDISVFRDHQRAAFQAERQRWEDQGLMMLSDEPDLPAAGDGPALPPGGQFVEASVPGNVWSIGVAPGDVVGPGQSLVVLESMKMEIEVKAPVRARVHDIHCAAGRIVRAGEPLVTLVPLEEAA
jgi:urea carboxylase